MTIWVLDPRVRPSGGRKCVPIEEISVIDTRYAVSVEADTEEQAEAIFARWYELNRRIVHLCGTHGCVHCSNKCNCSEEVRKEKKRIRSEMSQIEAFPVDC